MQLFYRGQGATQERGGREDNGEEEAKMKGKEVKMKEKEVKPKKGERYLDFEQQGKNIQLI